MLDREKPWRDSGLAPGIKHDDLVSAIHEVANGAKNAPTPPQPQARPAEWGTPQTPVERATEHYDRAAEIAKAEGKVSTVRLQKEFGIGMPEAARVRDQLIKDGVIDETGKKKPVEAAGDGKAAAANTAAPKGGEAIAARPKSAAEAFPELDVAKLSGEEQADLLAAHNDLEKAERLDGAYQEAGRCLTGG
jgi:DNA segregation ATPase FtsK/SpoIIIE-like protein